MEHIYKIKAAMEKAAVASLLTNEHPAVQQEVRQSVINSGLESPKDPPKLAPTKLPKIKPVKLSNGSPYSSVK